VTNVLLCTKALTGVGADIAAGNQLEKGKIADLVIRPMINNKIIESKINSKVILIEKMIYISKKISPKRLVISVNIALDKLTSFR